MTSTIAQRPQVTDLRGTTAAPRGSAVLEDPTGRRRRRLRIAGRTLAALLTLWVLTLLLGAVGLSPVSGVPLGRVLRPASAPPVQKKLPQPAAPTVAELEPALPVNAPIAGPGSTAPSAIPGSGGRTPAPDNRNPSKSTPRSVAVHTMPPAVDGSPGVTPTPAGRAKGVKRNSTTTTTPTSTTTAPGRSDTAPGKTKTTPAPHGGSGKTDTTTTTP
jgi:hypothetical protein